MCLFAEFLRAEAGPLAAHGVRVSVIGRRDRLPADVAAAIIGRRGGDDGGTRAVPAPGRRLLVARRDRSRRLPPARARGADARAIRAADCAEPHGGWAPDVDLLIRTGGEHRLSDFLLWESAYAELLFTPRMWPDFTGADLAAAVAEFRRRERRFGGLAIAAPPVSAMRDIALLWGTALALAVIGTALLFDAPAGVNWGIWTVSGRGRHRRLEPARRWRVVRVVPAPRLRRRARGGRRRHRGRMLPRVDRRAGSPALLAMAVLFAGDPRWDRMTAAFMLWAPIVAPLRALAEAVARAHGLVELVATPGNRPRLRGALLALPIVGLFGLILANADPVLATLRDDLVDALERLAFVPRLAFFSTILAGARGRRRAHRSPRGRPDAGRAGLPDPAPWRHGAPHRPGRRGGAVRVVPAPPALLSLRQRAGPGRKRDHVRGVLPAMGSGS